MGITFAGDTGVSNESCVDNQIYDHTTVDTSVGALGGEVSCALLPILKAFVVATPVSSTVGRGTMTLSLYGGSKLCSAAYLYRIRHGFATQLWGKSDYGSRLCYAAYFDFVRGRLFLLLRLLASQLCFAGSDVNGKGARQLQRQRKGISRTKLY